MSKEALAFLKSLADSALNGPDPRPHEVAVYPHEPPNLCKYYRFLWLLVRHMKARSVVETGTFRAASAYTFAAADPECRVLTLDTDPESKKRADALGCSNLKAVTTDSLQAFDVAREFSPIDILYLDSDHRYDLVKAEYELFAPLVRPGGVVVMDDIHMNAGMERFWAELKDPKIELNALHTVGFGAAVRP